MVAGLAVGDRCFIQCEVAHYITHGWATDDECDAACKRTQSRTCRKDNNGPQQTAVISDEASVDNCILLATSGCTKQCRRT